MSATQWANRGKQAIQSASTAPKQGKKNYGEPKRAVLDAIQRETYKTGSKGITATYTVDGLKYPLRERTVLEDAAGRKTPYGTSTVKRRLLAFGVDPSTIEGFDAMTEAEQDSLFSGLAPFRVCVFVKQEEYQGKQKPAVGLVVPIEDSPLKAASK
jgi:hypothetical protein